MNTNTRATFADIEAPVGRSHIVKSWTRTVRFRIYGVEVEALLSYDLHQGGYDLLHYAIDADDAIADRVQDALDALDAADLRLLDEATRD
jgi:hypothetical protein